MRTLDVYATSDIARSSFVFIDAFIAGQAYTFPRDTSNRPDGFLHEGTKRYVMPGLRQRPALVDAPMNGSMRPQYSTPNQVISDTAPAILSDIGVSSLGSS